jgi:hypothetical protein
MSEALYATRLYWAGTRGYAQRDGRPVRLAAPPALPGHPLLLVDAIDYTPSVHVAMVMPRHCGWREMTAEEVQAADQFLRAAVP